MVVDSTLFDDDVVTSDDILIVWDVVFTLADVVRIPVDVEFGKNTPIFENVVVVNLVDVVVARGGFTMKRASLSLPNTCWKTSSETAMSPAGSTAVVAVDDGFADAKFDRELFL